MCLRDAEDARAFHDMLWRVAVAVILATVGCVPLPLLLSFHVLTVAAAILFVLWSLYLLIRFAIAFSKAHRQLRRKWVRADRGRR